MKVKGNHPLAELIARHLSGIVSVPSLEANRMVNRAAMAAVKWHEEQMEQLSNATKQAFEIYKAQEDMKKWKE